MKLIFSQSVCSNFVIRYAIIVSVLSTAFQPAQAQRPNIIYIMADDLGYSDLSSYGRKDYKTAFLDKLAAHGVKLTNAYAAAPVCTPTRVAFMTGRYPARIQLGLSEPIDWSAKDSLLGLSPEYPSIAMQLGRAGYETFLVGKWHLGFKPEYSPVRNGFDYFFGFNGGGIDYISHRAPRGGNFDLFENEQRVSEEGYMTDILTEKALEIISKPRQKPFFLSLMFNAPHWPWQAPGDKAYPSTMPWVQGGSSDIYAAMMVSMDNAIGQIMQALDDKNIANNTVVIFTSDNGGERFSDMGIYRGKKMELWEGGIRVPAFVRWPGKIQPNTVCEQVAITMDWTKTILSIAGADKRSSVQMDGIDLTPVLTGKAKESNRTLYWRIFQRNQHKAMRDGKWKYIKDEKGTEYLFDLSLDPSEKNDLKTKQTKVFNQLREKYRLWEATVLQPVALN